jgi:hypothetical protein
VWSREHTGSIILDDELNKLIQELTAKRVVVLIDACYSASAAEFRSRRRQRAGNDEPVLYVMSAPFEGSGEPAVIPGQFVSDGGRVVPGDSLSMVMFAAATDSGRAYSVSRWPPTSIGRSVFSYYLDATLSHSSGNETFGAVIESIRAQARGWDQCRTKGKCQIPQVTGALKSASIDDVFGKH